MNYFLLAETDFFRRINEIGDCNMEKAYTAFATQVIELCIGSPDTNRTIIALAYIEIELQHHPVRNLPEEKKEIANYVSKALSFVRKMQKFLAAPQVPPLIPIQTSTDNTNENTASPLQWTGNAIDLASFSYTVKHNGEEVGAIVDGDDQRDGLYQQRQYAAQTARPTPVQDIRCGIKGLLPFLHRHQTPEEREPHLFP